jgi:hypothetical protein
MLEDSYDILGLVTISISNDRKAEMDDKLEMRLVRLRRTSDCESVISRNKAGELICQDQIIRLRPPQPVLSESDITVFMRSMLALL